MPSNEKARGDSRERIEAAALKLFAEREFHHVGLDEIANGARASLQTIYRHYGSKEAIPSKTVTRLNKGDRLTIRTAGGAGWGDPASRDAEASAEDLAGGKVGGGAAP